MHDLNEKNFKKEIYGIVLAHVFMVKFQKQWLPHIHLVLILKEGDKNKSGDQCDRFISPKIADKYDFPILHILVFMHMMHGSCGNKSPTNTYENG